MKQTNFILTIFCVSGSLFTMENQSPLSSKNRPFRAPGCAPEAALPRSNFSLKAEPMPSAAVATNPAATGAVSPDSPVIGDVPAIFKNREQ